MMKAARLVALVALGVGLAAGAAASVEDRIRDRFPAVSAQLGCHPDALVYRHVVVGEIAGKTEVICFAVPRDVIKQMMDALRAAKIA